MLPLTAGAIFYFVYFRLKLSYSLIYFLSFIVKVKLLYFVFMLIFLFTCIVVNWSHGAMLICISRSRWEGPQVGRAFGFLPAGEKQQKMSVSLLICVKKTPQTQFCYGHSHSHLSSLILLVLFKFMDK